MTLILPTSSKVYLILPTNSKVYMYCNKQIKLYIEVATLVHGKIELGKIKFVIMIFKLENH